MNFREYARIVVVGSPGSGKSTLAREISAFDGRPAMYLDDERYPNVPQEEFVARQKRFMQNERWVIDGVFPLSLEMRFTAADLVIFLDLPKWLCCLRAFRRYTRVRTWVKRQVFYKYYPRLLVAYWNERYIRSFHFLLLFAVAFQDLERLRFLRCMRNILK